MHSVLPSAVICAGVGHTEGTHIPDAASVGGKAADWVDVCKVVYVPQDDVMVAVHHQQQAVSMAARTEGAPTRVSKGPAVYSAICNSTPDSMCVYAMQPSWASGLQKYPHVSYQCCGYGAFHQLLYV